MEVLEQIVSLLKDKDDLLRKIAINSLGVMLHIDPDLAKDLYEQITPLLEDENEGVRYSASRVLDSIQIAKLVSVLR